MKILLISPAREKHAYTNKGMMIPQLALFIIQGLTPKKHTVRIVEQEYMTVDYDEDCDVVGISCMTSNAVNGYKIAQEFKKRGKIIIMGGIHPTILPDEALQYADSVVIGEVEGVWEQVLIDIQNNNLQRTYNNPNPDLSRYIPKDFSTLKSKRAFNILPLMTTRGCPYNCDFCCVSQIYGKKVKHIPVQNIVRDIVESRARNFIFLDDNIVGDRKYARELFNAIKPLKIRWIGQASISFADDTEMMKLARQSGCVGLFIGLESVVESQAEKFKKLRGGLKKTEESLRKIRKMGIIIQGSVIFGFDTDTHDIFQETLDFLIRNKISLASINILTPYPGTKLYEELKNEGRIINNSWEYYDHHTVVFRPKNMTPLELQLNKIKTKEKFFNLWSLLKRFPGNLHHPIMYLVVNIGYMKLAKAEKKRILYIESTMCDKHQDESYFVDSMTMEVNVMK